jgi:hypothetical protein
MIEDRLELLAQLLTELKESTEEYVMHETMMRKSEDYLLIIALEKYLESWG